MTDDRRIDPRSLIIGFLCAVIILLLFALANAKKETAAVAPPAQSRAPTGYIDRFQQEQMAARTIEQRIESMLDKLIGSDRSLVRARVVLNDDGSVQRQHIALSVDKTRVVQDPNIGEYVEENLTAEEIEQLAQMAREAAGLDANRGDVITVFAINFDRTQEIVVREEAKAHAREHFWTEVPLFALLPLILFLFLRWRVHRKPDSDLAGFFARPDNRAGLMVASGLFLCAGALGFWEHIPRYGMVAIPGACLLLAGLCRAWVILAGTQPAVRTP